MGKFFEEYNTTLIFSQDDWQHIPHRKIHGSRIIIILHNICDKGMCFYVYWCRYPEFADTAIWQLLKEEFPSLKLHRTVKEDGSKTPYLFYTDDMTDTIAFKLKYM